MSTSPSQPPQPQPYFLDVPRDAHIVDHPTATTREDWERVASEYAPTHETGIITSQNGRVLLWARLRRDPGRVDRYEADEAKRAFALHFRTDPNAPPTMNKWGMPVLAMDAAHVAMLTDKTPGPFMVEREGVYSLDYLLKAGATLRDLYGEDAGDVLVTFARDQDWPVLLTVKGQKVSIILAPRRGRAPIVAGQDEVA